MHAEWGQPRLLAFYPWRARQYPAIVPNLATYNATISAKGKASGANKLYVILRAMQHYAITPDVITCTATVSGRGKGQQHQQALRLLRARQRHAITLDVSRTTAISACEKDQQHQQAFHLMSVTEPCPHAYVNTRNCSVGCAWRHCSTGARPFGVIVSSLGSAAPASRGAVAQSG